MSASSQVRKSSEEVTKIGEAILRKKIEPMLGPEGKGKFVAIAIDSGEFEIDDRAQAAMKRLLARYPDAYFWLGRAGYKAAFTLGPR